ncbi:MAG TPA: sugar phosphate isomerase/epimerase family protein [Isosphaeraceae bacterium]|jgi:sugar phosphate isomerase/epimerase|nr:sugar phosphate isomerase/epimerase family protein [Isosphaeraceae bacterium]
MIRSPLGLRLDPARPIKDQIQEAARLGAKGVVADATGELAPDRLSETGRRELRHLLRTVQLDLIALHLPTRRAFDTDDQLDDRLTRADRAFSLAFELGGRLILARVGAVPPESEAPRREMLLHSLRELGRRADHRGVRLAIETGTEPGDILRPLLDTLDSPGLAASIDPTTLLSHGHDPNATTRSLGPWAAHAYLPRTTRSSQGAHSREPLGFGFPSGTLDWEEYLGSLEEINYRGYMTFWPDPSMEVANQFAAIKERASRF